MTIPDGSYRTLELTFENEPYSGLTIRKVSYQDGRGLSELQDNFSGIQEIQAFCQQDRATDTNGRIIITNLESDQYYTIKELQPPINHLLDEEDVRTILVKPDALNQNITLVFRNKEKPKIEISKVDDKGNPIANCTFRISRRDSAEYTTATTDINGKALVEGLYEDWYQVEETRSADGFILDWEAQNVELEAGKTTKLQFVNYTKPGLTIRKVDAATGQGLDGAVIRVWRDYDYDSSEGPSPTVAESFALPLTRNYIGASYQDYTTTGGGYVRLEGLDAGVVLVQEQSAPQGFYRDDSVHRVELIPGESHEIVIRNYRLAKLNIRKIDATTGQGLDGAVIRVWREGVDEYQDYISSGGGYIRLIDQPAGFVLMQEQKVPSGYQIDDTIHRVELKLGQTHDVVIQNTRLATLTVRKIDSATGRGLDGAVFRVWREGVDEHQDYTTAGGGYIRLTDQAAGFVLLQELRAPDSYQLDEQIHRIELTLAQNHDLIIENHRLPKLTIKKIDEQTLNGIEGVTFRLTKDGEFRDVTTGKDGLISVQLSPGWWTYEETSVPNGWILDPTPGHVELVTGQDKEIVVKNRHKPSLKIVKLDAVTRQPMADVGFEISVKNGAPVGTYRTDNNGEIMLVDINPNTYVIKELPFPGYIALETQKEVFVDWGKVMTVEFRNQPKSPIFIKKINSVTGEPLEGALFSVSKVDGTFIGEYRTGRNGYATVAGVQPGFYLIAEKQPAPGFILDEAAKIVELKLDSVVEVEFLNRPLNGIEIYKIDSKTREPLEGAEFTVKTKAGELIGVYKTSVSGRIEIPELQPGWYSVYESATSSPEYLLDGTVRDVELKFNDHVLLEFSNTKYSGVQVQKVDSVTKAPIQGAKFRVTKLSGDIIGEYVTGPSGFFVVEGLEPGTYYTCFETATVPGYIHDPTPQTFKVSKGESALIQFENAPLSGLQIRKTDSVTGLPLAGVEFKLTELNGRLIGNYTTPDSGIIFVEDLKPGYYVVQEVKSLPTHKPDTAPRNVEIKTGELNVVEYRNRPYPVLELQKVDADTLQPLSGVRFKLLDRYQREIGIYTTSELGKITLSGMDEGKFFLQEVEAKAGYQLDSTVREVSLQWGKTTTVEVKNTPLATLRIKKIDAISKKPLPGVVFLLRDMKNNIIGEYTTNSSGLIELPKTIASGKYKLQEIKTDDQHVLDEQIREIELKAGETTELVIENAPKRGRFQIVKKAADANPVTGAKAGALLKGAEFEILNEKLEVVDTIETDKNGVATSIDLPLGKYAIRETESAEYYLLDDSVFYGELKLHGDLVRFEVLNKSAILDVTIEKRGNVEVIPGDLLRYDFMNITNASNVELHDFYWRDVLPTDAVRLETLHTGTWSQRVRFDVEYRTNQRKNWRTWESGLNSNTANELNVKDLKLAANEYVTEFQLVFDTVAPEFHCTEDPYIITKTLEDLEGGYVFTNRTDVGGTVDGEEWIYAKDQWRTSVFALPKEPLPRTGY